MLLFGLETSKTSRGELYTSASRAVPSRKLDFHAISRVHTICWLGLIIKISKFVPHSVLQILQGMRGEEATGCDQELSEAQAYSGVYR